MTERPSPAGLRALHAARLAEKAQTRFYRALAALAEDVADEATAERLNGLLADEQHHFSRLSARLLELGETLPDSALPVDVPALAAWEEDARAREQAEITRYETLLELELDERTRAIVNGFLAVERQHAAALGGKYMDA
jgi:rubrerythrin